MRRNWDDHSRSLYTRNFQPKGQNEEKMTWTTLLSLVKAKRHIFQDPRILRQAHLERWAWRKIRGAVWPKFSQPIIFISLIIFQKCHFHWRPFFYPFSTQHLLLFIPDFVLKGSSLIIRSHIFLLPHVWPGRGIDLLIFAGLFVQYLWPIVCYIFLLKLFYTIRIFFAQMFLHCIHYNGRLLSRWRILSISRTSMESNFALDELLSTPISAHFSSNACFKFWSFWCWWS